MRVEEVAVAVQLEVAQRKAVVLAVATPRVQMPQQIQVAVVAVVAETQLAPSMEETARPVFF